MQLYALDKSGNLISSQSADKQTNYYCLECQGVVRLRGGTHRQNHFYHLDITPSCRQNGKSLIHLQVQYYIQKNLPEEESVIEMRFPQINRIADVVWISQKIVFEVQCSWITQAEVMERNLDYLSIGYQVVWILHDNRFNQSTISAAEIFLRPLHLYYTNIDENGEGNIYDQFDLVHEGMRKQRLSPLPIKISQLNRQLSLERKIPSFIQKRLEQLPFAFEGDLLDRVCKPHWSSQTMDYIQIAFNLEETLKPGDKRAPIALKTIFYDYFLNPYLLFFQMLLEKACK
jgi:competence protein CoiA